MLAHIKMPTIADYLMKDFSEGIFPQFYYFISTPVC